MKLWYMNDNHTFCELPHDVEGALAVVRRQFEHGQTHGMLCAKGGRPEPGPLDVDRNAHGHGDFAEFEPRARVWLVEQLTYKSPADLEYESWPCGLALPVKDQCPATQAACQHVDKCNAFGNCAYGVNASDKPVTEAKHG